MSWKLGAPKRCYWELTELLRVWSPQGWPSHKAMLLGALCDLVSSSFSLLLPSHEASTLACSALQ